MKALLIYAHPNPASFCAALKITALDKLAELGVETRVHELYNSQFEPVLSVQDFEELGRGQVSSDVTRLQTDITWADWLLFIHPTWWMGTPAIMKGYFDRVFSNGFAFQTDEKGPHGLLVGKKAMIFQTAGGTEETLVGSGLSQAIHKIAAEGIMEFCGINLVSHQFFYAVPTVGAETRSSMLTHFRTVLSQMISAAPLVNQET